MSTSAPTKNPRNNPFLPSNKTISDTSTPDSKPNHESDPNLSTLTEELPPAYTPAADMQQGESSVEFGPRRPFQPAPPPLQQLPPPLSTSVAQSSLRGRPFGQPRDQQNVTGSSAALGTDPIRRPSSTGPLSTTSNLLAYPGQASTHVRSSSTRLPPPPPRHPSSSSTSLPSSAAPDRSAVSDFTRDFYSAGATTTLTPPTSDPPPSTSSGSRYAPPPGPPPPPQPPRSNTSERVPDDGRPTKTATPGRPLLYNDQTLVYPTGHVCDKCNNTGYKANDPANPCRKCWSKYAKPYTGALLYASWPSNSSSTTTDSATTFQRPLPRFQPPHSLVPTSGPSPSPDRNLPRPHGPSERYQSHARSAPPPPAAPRPAPRVLIADPIYNRPPPGALVLPPGDSRLGGLLCWKCGGAGVVPFFIFDEISCETCGGIGRVFPPP